MNASIQIDITEVHLVASALQEAVFLTRREMIETRNYCKMPMLFPRTRNEFAKQAFEIETLANTLQILLEKVVAIQQERSRSNVRAIS
jgi:hypothetical protein